MEHKQITIILDEAKRIATKNYEEAYAFLLEEMEGIPWLIFKEKLDSKNAIFKKFDEYSVIKNDKWYLDYKKEVL